MSKNDKMTYLKGIMRKLNKHLKDKNEIKYKKYKLKTKCFKNVNF